MRVVNSGDLVKKYRTLLKISQKEAAGHRMSHSMVSLIESRKIQLTTVTAMILIDNFNKIAISKGIELDLSLKDLLGKNNCDLEESLQASLDQIKCSTSKIGSYEDIYSRAKESNCFGIMSQIRSIQGKIAENNEDYPNAIEYYCKACDYCKVTQDNKGMAEVLVGIIRCHNRLNQYIYAEEYVNKLKSELYSKYLDEQIMFAVNFEILYTLVNTNRNVDALNIIESLLKWKRITNKQKQDILMIKASVFIEMERYNEASSILKKIIATNHSLDYLIYHKFAIVTIMKGLTSLGDKYISECIEFLSINKNENHTKVAIKLANEFKKYTNSKSIIKYYVFALDNCEYFNQEDYKVQCYTNLFRLYNDNSDLNEFEQYAMKIKNSIIKNEQSENLPSYLIILSKYYLSTNNIQKFRELVNGLFETI